MSHSLAIEFIAAWKAGRVCLHPTDTLPGLTCNPDDAHAVAVLRRFKQRFDERTFISLVADLPSAERFWQPLPPGWRIRLQGLWPGGLSIAWEASPLAPRGLVGADGTIALRCPQLDARVGWMQKVLKELGSLVPSTSVNRGGEPACSSWREAVDLAGEQGFYVPKVMEEPPIGTSASTLIRLAKDGSYTLLRQGAVSL